MLVEPTPWRRLARRDDRPDLAVHVGGPRRGDVVVVTDESVLASPQSGRLPAREALAPGRLRLHGLPQRVESARVRLAGSKRPAASAATPGHLDAR